jgi:oligosaccharide repeat unit polymerase
MLYQQFMEQALYTAVAICCYMTLLAALIVSSKPRPVVSPGIMFAIFVSITWSPLTFIPIEATHVLWVSLSQQSQYMFTISYALMCLNISVGVLIGTSILRTVRRKVVCCRALQNDEKKRLLWLLLAISIIIAVVYLGSAERINYLAKIIAYINDGGGEEYYQLRRETQFEGFIMSSLFGRLQFSLVLVVCAGWAVFVLRPLNIFAWKLRNIAGLLILTSVFVVCAATVSKLPYAFYLAMLFLMYVVLLQLKGVSFQRLLLILSTGLVLLSIIGMLLYVAQYKEASFQEIIAIAVFRLFRAYPDGFKLYLELMPSIYSHTGFETISIFNHGEQAEIQPYIFIPRHYGLDGTSFPSGFVSYAYADWGVLGIVVYSILVGLLIAGLNDFVKRRPFQETKAIAAACCGISVFWLCAIPFSTSLLTGGLLVFPIVIMCAEYIVRKQTRYLARCQHSS